ncbi:MAG: two pore domain potassium channel family protein [Alphaproteobacteria bacterium]|nr:MAG: two pore domain potassium channel family protein [Alphaproteobacteria bacterium]
MAPFRMERSANLEQKRFALKRHKGEAAAIARARRAARETPLNIILIQLGAALVTVALCALLHAAGLQGISKLFHIEDEELEKKSLGLETAWLIVVIALSLFVLHLAEIGLFGALYLALGAASSLEEALFFSLASYTTAGTAAVHLIDPWRLLGAAEALAGFLLIGWSTAYLVAKLRKLGE